jgi:hypothetical protein
MSIFTLRERNRNNAPLDEGGLYSTQSAMDMAAGALTQILGHSATRRELVAAMLTIHPAWGASLRSVMKKLLRAIENRLGSMNNFEGGNIYQLTPSLDEIRQVFEVLVPLYVEGEDAPSDRKEVTP